MDDKIKRISVVALKIVGYALAAVVGLFVLVWVALQFPQTQTFVVGKLTNWVSGKTKTAVRIGRVDIDFFKTLVLEGVYLEDRQRDTLLYAGKLRVNVGLQGLRNQRIVLNLVGLDNAVVNLTKAEGDKKFNYEYLLEAFQSDPTPADTTASAWTFDLERVDFRKVRFNYADATARNDLRLGVQRLETDIETLGLEQKHPRIRRLLLEGMNVSFEQPMAEADTLGAALAQATQTDTIAAAVRKSVQNAGAGNPPPTTQAAALAKDSPFNESGYAVNVGEIRIVRSAIRYEVTGAPVPTDQFDYQHLALQDLNLTLVNLALGANDFAADLKQLSFRERSGLEIDQLSLSLNANLPRVEAHLRTLRTPHSALDNASLSLVSVWDTPNLLKNLRLEANFEDDSLAVRDAAFFTNAFDTLPALQGQTLAVDGNLRVENADVSFENFRLALNGPHSLTGTLLARNVDNLSATNLDLRLEELRTDIRFIEQFLPANTLPASARRLGEMRLQAHIKGRLSEATAQMALTSNVGNLNADLRLSTNPTFDRNFIGGIIRSDNLDAGKLVGNSLGKIAFVLDADASQVNNQVAVQKADLLVKRLVYNRYAYRNVRLRGSYLKKLAKAALSATDSNLQLEAAVSTDLSRPKILTNFNAKLLRIDPRKLNLTTDTLQASLRLDADVEGTNPDEMTVNAILSGLKVVKQGKTVALDTLTLVAGLQQGIRFIRLDSEILKADMTGRFTVGELPRALNLLVKEYFSPYPTSAARLRSPQTMDFNLFIKENPLVIESLVSGLRIPEAIQLKGRFESNENRLVADGTVPLLIYGSQRIAGLQLDARTNERKLTLRAKAERVNLSATDFIPEPSVSINFKKDDATFNLRLANEKADTRLNFSGQLLIRKDTYNLRVLPSEVFIKKHKWEIAPNASLTYGPKYLWIDDLVISQGDQRIAVTSQRLSPGNVQLNTEIHQFEIGEFINLVKPLGYSLGGILDGTATVSDLFGKPAAQADLKMVGFSVDQSQIGDVALRAGKASDSQQMSLSASVQGQNDMALEGTYHTVQKENNLNFRLDIERIQLAQFTVFAKEYVSELAGDLRASLTVQGSPEKPRVVGSVFFDSTLINAKFTNVPYLLRQQYIRFEGDQFAFNEFTIQDNLARKAVLTGQVSYADLKNTLVDLRFKTDAFQVLDTREGNDQPVYGNLLTAANLTIRGPVTNIVVDGDVRILDETRLGVPLAGGTGKIQQADYIRFVVPDTIPPIDTSLALPTSATKPATSYRFALNMRIRTQPEAVLRIVIDEQSGDALECSGRADLKVEMSAQGDINLVGDYRLEKGQYSMSLFGLLRRDFAIEKGSTLRWTGDPTNAQVDITAVYQTRAARYELVANQTLSSDEKAAAESPAPVNVYLRMQGELLKPTITFDLKIPRSLVGSLDLKTEDELTNLRNNELDLNKQVFGLIALNRFVLDNVPNTGGGNGFKIGDRANEQAGQTVSQLLTSQLNKLSDNYLGGVEFSLDLKSTTEGSYSSSLSDKQLGVNLSKKLLNDRLTVSVGSNVGLGNSGTAVEGGNRAGTNDLKNIIGDFSVQYRLLKSGRLNLKFFRRVDPNILNSNNAPIIGASVQHTRSFDRLRDFFRLRRPKKAEVGVE